MKVITTVVGELGTNCYLLIDEATREAALIDPADSPDELSALIEREGVTLRYILLTHGHRDHTLAAPAMHKRYPAAAVYIHRLDANGSGIYHYPLEGVIDSLNYYDEGDTLPLGSLTISVLYTPGHTAGSVTLKVGDALFVGDTLFAGSCGRTDLPGGDPMEMLASASAGWRATTPFTPATWTPPPSRARSSIIPLSVRHYDKKERTPL